jgi:hypothetical protein
MTRAWRRRRSPRVTTGQIAASNGARDSVDWEFWVTPTQLVALGRNGQLPSWRLLRSASHALTLTCRSRSITLRGTFTRRRIVSDNYRCC